MREKILTSLCFFGILFLVAVSFFAAPNTFAQISNGTYELESSVISTGGGSLSAGDYDLTAVIGETFVGRVTSGVYDLFIGFLKPTTACSDGLDNDGDGLVDLDDNGCVDLDDTNEFLVSGGGGGGGSGGDPGECTVTASPSSVLAGESSTISWSGVSLQSSGHQLLPFGAVSSSGSRVVSPTTTTSYQGTFFDIGGGTITCSASVSVVTGGAGEVGFSPDFYQFSEGSGVVSLLIERSGGASGPARATVVLDASIIAQEGVDYVFASGDVEWADGESGIKTVPIELLDDALIEGPESLEFAITDVEGLVLGEASTATLQIVDNETEPIDPIVTVITSVNNRGVGSLRSSDVIVSVNGNAVTSGQTLTLPAFSSMVFTSVLPSPYSVSSITGSSYCPGLLGQYVTLPEGEAIVCRINVRYDGPVVTTPPPPDPILPPPTPTPTPTPIPTPTTTPPVLDPENIPLDPVVTEPDLGATTPLQEISLQAARLWVEEDSAEVLLYVSREGLLDGVVEVDFVLISDTALYGADYGDLQENKLVFASGEGGLKKLVVPLVADDLPEADESFKVSINSVSTGSIGNRTTRVTIRDGERCLELACLFAVEEQQAPAETNPVQEEAPNPFVLGSARSIIESDDGKRGVITGAFAGISAGLAAAMVFFAANPGALADIASLPARIWSLLLSLFGLRRRNQPWGVVYDSITKQPLDPAYVILRAEDTGEEVATSITDIDGRYGFLTKSGTYRLEAAKTHYVFPSKLLSGKQKDELYDRLYFGDTLRVLEDGQVITHNIPLDPVGKDWNQQVKAKMRVTRFYNKHSVLIAILTDVVFYLGVALTAIAVLLSPERYNIILLSIYGVIMLLRIVGVKSRRFGRVLQGDTGNPVAHAVLKFTSPTTGVQVARRMTDGMGRYYALISKGVYMVSIEVVQPDGVYKQVASYQNIKTKQGIIRKFFKV